MNLTDDPRYYAFGVNGAMFMMIAHGITSTGMFFLVGVIYERAPHPRPQESWGACSPRCPPTVPSSFLIFFGSMGLPGLCGFIAEAFVVLSHVQLQQAAGRPRCRRGGPDRRLHPLDASAGLPGPE